MQLVSRRGVPQPDRKVSLLGFRLINVNVLTNRLELRDQWHADKSDENANHIYSFCNSMFHLLMRLFVISDIALEVAANSELNRPLGVLELRSDRKPRNDKYEELTQGRQVFFIPTFFDWRSTFLLRS